MNIGEKIKEIRKLKKMTQKQLGEILNVSQQMIGKYENSKEIPKLETIRKISQALDVDYLELLGEEKINEVKRNFKIICPWQEKWVLIYSGIYQTFKNNDSLCWKWCYKTQQDIEHQINDLKKIKFDFNVPFHDYDRDLGRYSKSEYDDHINYLEELKEDIEDIFETLDEMIEDERNNKFKIDDIILNTADKRQVFLNQHIVFVEENTINIDYYNSLSDDEIEKEFDKLVEKLKLENEKLKYELNKIGKVENHIQADLNKK